MEVMRGLKHLSYEEKTAGAGPDSSVAPKNGTRNNGQTLLHRKLFMRKSFFTVRLTVVGLVLAKCQCTH